MLPYSLRQCLVHFFGGLEPLGRLFADELLRNPGELIVPSRIDGDDGQRLGLQNLLPKLVRSRRIEGGSPGKQLVEDHAQAVEVRSAVESFPENLLRSHVAEG